MTGEARLAPNAGCTCFRVRRLARRMTQFYDEVLAPVGISINQFGVLGALRHGGPLTMSDLARLLGMDRTTLTRNLRPLQAAGLVSIEPGRDQRQRIVAATEPGRAALRQAAPLWRRAQDEVARRLGRATVAELNAMLDGAFAALPGGGGR